MGFIQRHLYKGLILLGLIVLMIFVNKAFLEINPELIQQWILSWGFWAPLIFIALFTVRPFTFFPSPILAVTGGLAFGAGEGFIYTWIGSFAGAVVSFWAARSFGKSLVKKEWPGGARKIKYKIEKKGFTYIFILRLIPFVQFDLVSYLAAMSRVRFSAYFVATLFGILPGAFAYSFLGSSVASGQFQMVMAALVVLLVIFLFVPLWLRKKIK